MGPTSKNVKTHDTPAESSKILHANEDGATWKHTWNYRAVVGCLNYLQAMSQPNLVYSIHQCACYCNNPKLLHDQGLKHICCYLYLTRNQGLGFQPKLTDGFKCYVHADWARNWLKTGPNDKTGALFSHRILNHLRKLPYRVGFQNAVTRGTQYMEAELIASSTALREVIHLQNLLLELCGCNFPIPFTKPQVACRTFKDNAECIEVAQSDHKIRPRTKHISMCLFHFCDHVEKGLIKTDHVPSKFSSTIFLQNLCPMTNTCTSVIKSWGGRPLHLLNTRECEVIMGSASKGLFPSSQYCL